jgi:hypothetical protein
VVEDRRSVIAAVVAAAHFVIANARAMVGVYLMNVTALAGVVAAYAVVAPGVGGAGLGMWAALLAGQLYVIARLCVKLSFWGGAVAVLQARLAYPRFVRTLPNTALPTAEMRAPVVPSA